MRHQKVKKHNFNKKNKKVNFLQDTIGQGGLLELRLFE